MRGVGGADRRGGFGDDRTGQVEVVDMTFGVVNPGGQATV